MASPAGRGDAGPDSGSSRPCIGRFPPTHWTVVISAGKDSSPDAREAFGRLYETYRSALVAFLRGQGRTEDEASELVHGFFAFLLENRSLGKVRREGRFRSWLLICLKYYLADLWDKLAAQKRGANQPHVPLGTDTDQGEVDPPQAGRTPDEEFDRQFALRFLEQVMARLEQEFTARGKAQVFQQLYPWLLDKKGGMSHAEVGRQLGMSETAVNKEVSRLRERYRAIFDGELLNLVATPQELADEKRFLFAAVSR